MVRLEFRRAVFWTVIVSHVHLGADFSILENKLIDYDDGSTLIPVVPASGARVTVAESLKRDLALRSMVSGDLCGMN